MRRYEMRCDYCHKKVPRIRSFDSWGDATGSVVWPPGRQAFERKQPTMSRSSTEAEYHALAYAVAEVLWISSMIRELRLLIQRPLLICCDNLGATFLAANTVQHHRTKHVDIANHFVREQVRAGGILVKYVLANAQKVEILTKRLSGRHLAAQRASLLTCSQPGIAGVPIS
ncbi:hypothetical protein MLD38_004115 [Melastoma candidum]|uniref:Uncharacterized protein n=1 Tax=Melastoma candidum TaxID=119954 RepID=A0ACB9S6M2_9MYRT|nr:hypothetical protein MLD38_004115 [Melastoma candidum]